MQVRGGTHITLEIILKKGTRYVALLRPQGVPGHAIWSPKKRLYFCHDLLRVGEPISNAVRRIVKAQAGVGVKSIRVLDIETAVHNKHHAVIPIIVAVVRQMPRPGRYGNKVAKVVAFTKGRIPSGFDWWTKKELRAALKA